EIQNALVHNRLLIRGDLLGSCQLHRIAPGRQSEKGRETGAEKGSERRVPGTEIRGERRGPGAEGGSERRVPGAGSGSEGRVPREGARDGCGRRGCDRIISARVTCLSSPAPHPALVSLHL